MYIQCILKRNNKESSAPTLSLQMVNNRQMTSGFSTKQTFTFKNPYQVHVCNRYFPRLKPSVICHIFGLMYFHSCLFINNVLAINGPRLRSLVVISGCFHGYAVGRLEDMVLVKCASVPTLQTFRKIICYQ